MNMKTKVFAFGFFVVKFVFAQCPEYDLKPPHLSNVQVKGVVTQNIDSKVLVYTYSIVNGSTSTGCINGMDIDVSLAPNSLDLSDTELIDYPRYVDRIALKFDTTVHATSIGIPTLPKFKGIRCAWSASFSVEGFVGWFRLLPQLRLQPGAEMDGLIMTSLAIPGIRRFVVSPSYSPKPKVAVTPENEDSLYMNTPETTPEEEDAFQQLEDSIKVRGFTIGPTPPPFPFIAGVFLDSLSKYAVQSWQLGWIHNQATANKYLEYFSSAKTNLRSNNANGAQAILQTVLRDANADSTSNLSTEAYALIRYNTEYLLARLR
jgi:hypothetical protein